MDYKTVASESKFKGEILDVRVDQVVLPSGRKAEREVVSHKGAVGLIPITADNNLILVRQYRHPISGELIEIPAGKLDKGEKPVDCARRELCEETGMTSDKITELARFYTTPGYSNEFFYLYLAECLKTADLHEQPEEEIVGTMTITFDQALNMIDSEEIKDGKTIAAICLAKIHLDRLG